tara:strand:- start:251 stop:622 length:372 start_codon:yes stop_codon:yes gene_type:complete
MYSLIDEAWNNIPLDNLSNKIYESFEPIKKNDYDNVSEINNIYSDLNTEDVLPDFKKNELSCDELINKVLSCEKCKKVLIKKLLSENLVIPNLNSNETKEIMILILIGLIIIIIIDLFIRISS